MRGRARCARAESILYVKIMINAHSQGRVIDISVAGLMTSVQEIILSFRHGEKDEDLVNHRAEPSDVYRLLEVNLQPNEQRRAAAVFEYKGLVFRLVPKRYFEHPGSLNRFIYLKKGTRKRSSRPRDEWGQIASWGAAAITAVGPTALRIATKKGDNDCSPIAGKCSLPARYGTSTTKAKMPGLLPCPGCPPSVRSGPKADRGPDDR